MSESAVAGSSTIVLRKRKRSPAPLVLRISSSPSPSVELCSESDFEPKSIASRNAKAGPSHISESKTESRPYRCTYAGCKKAYSKPSRFAEHQRSHTGDRPFVCITCKKSYFRDSHLQAHARTHLPESAKTFVCDEPGCGKRFWTSQHLRVHENLHKGEKPLKCSEPSCNATFSKHHQLRAHICTAHSPPGTKPYQCEHTGCTKSFTTNQKLRAHTKTHDDKRYTCVHQSCLPAAGTTPTCFQTWSALQHHMRTAHPPTCPYSSCNGKTFTAQKGLRAHLKIHAECDLEAELENDLEGSADEDEERPRKRRRGGEVGRDWVCEEPGCGKDFKSKKALNTHHNVTHLKRRDFVCSHPGCERTFGYKHLLQRHVAKAHWEDSDDAEPEPPSGSDEAETSDGDSHAAPLMTIDFITGNSYKTRSQAQLGSVKTLQCPYPILPPSLMDDDTLGGDLNMDHIRGKNCEYVFCRAYDLRRHLQSEHDIEVAREKADSWVRQAKKEKLTVTGNI